MAAMRILVLPIGNLGNQMLQTMLLEALRRRLPELQVEGIDLPEWNVRPAPSAPIGSPALRLIGQYVDVPLIERMLRAGLIHELEFAALGFRMEHYLPPSEYRPSFPRRPMGVPEFLSTSLLINVRGAETLGDVHADYGPMPIAFYRQVVEETKLPPIFMGQVGTDAYSDALRAAFPTAPIIESRGAMADFELMRSARHVVVSVSTFSWLAAWLSDAQTVHLPVLGMLNPEQREDIDLLPVSDERYRFYRFPVRRWNGAPMQFADLLAPARFDTLAAAELAAVQRRAAQRLAPAARGYARRLHLRAALLRHLRVGGRVGLRR